MTPRSAIAAMLWESWRLTRGEVVLRLALGILVASLLLAGRASRSALLVLVWICIPYWISVAKLNGGRLMEGYGHGYPFHCLFTYPVPASVLVGVPMACQALSIAGVYLVSALVLRAAFGAPFPLLPLAAVIAAWQTLQWTLQWGITSRTGDWVGSLAALAGFGTLAQELPGQFELSIGGYALLVAVAAASFGLGVAGVARQRRGDAEGTAARKMGWRTASDWWASLCPVPCPTSSAVRAQIWFDFRSSGLLVLTAGTGLALAIPLLFLVLRLLIAPDSQATAAIAALLASAPVAVLLLASNAFGIRARQGRRYASAFEATRACATARMAGLKVLVRTVCVLAACGLAAASVWAASQVIPLNVPDARIGTSPSPLVAWIGVAGGAVAAMSAYGRLALAFVGCVLVAVMVALQASLDALLARYPLRTGLTLALPPLLLISGFVLLLLAHAAHLESHALAGHAMQLAGAVFVLSPWLALVAVTLTTLGLLWRSLAERLLTLRWAGLAVLVSALFAAAWLTVLQAVGVPISTRTTAGAVWMLSPALLPLLAAVLAPWSLSRVRHT